MSIRSKASRSWLAMKMAFTRKRFASLSVVLILMLVADVLSVSAVSTTFNPIHRSELQAASTLTFITDADAKVQESNPDTNAGTTTDLEVIKASNRNIESYLRFPVSGVS